MILITNVMIVNFTHISYVNKQLQGQNYTLKLLVDVKYSSIGLQTFWEKDKHYTSYIQNSYHKIHGNIIYGIVIYIGRLNIFLKTFLRMKEAYYFIFIVNATSCQSTILNVVVNVVM